MSQPLLGFLAFALGTVVVLTVPVLAVWLLVQLLRGLGYVVGGGVRGVSAAVRHVARFVRGEIVDTLHFAGSILTGMCIAPLAVGNVAIGRLRAARHYGAALEDEFTSALVSLYRVGLGHPVRLVGLGALTDGLERRLPDLVADEPRTSRIARGAAAPKRRMRSESPEFDGYELHGELRAGGSGARLFRATPTLKRVEALGARGIDTPSQVVIKAFDIGYGSTLPQIVRESRSLEAAKRLGLILEHELGEDAFHYVMPFVPGQDLDALTRQLHASSGTAGLDGDALQQALTAARDLCTQLDRFHSEGLWHKDIKPSNLLVSERRLHVVDFGLATPLESALTLTTHGTEFFRDPELVRLALAGKRVKDVDGVKFDLYSAGAVLYSMVENSFPAHGSLSSISKRAPEALRWIIRRAMADVDKRYASAHEMGRDLDVLLLARDPYTVRPADLPSVRGDVADEPRRGLFGGGARAAQQRTDGPNGTDEDVRRFEAFGNKVEVRGLGRIKSSVARARSHSPRAERKRRRAEAAAAQERGREEEARLAANAQAFAAEAKTDARTERRGRRRGMLRAVLVLAIFVGILGGAATTLLDGGSKRTFSQAYSILAPNVGPVASAPSVMISNDSSQPLSRRAQERIAQLGRRARVLVVSDSANRVLAHESARAGQELRKLGAIPVGVPGEAGLSVDASELELLGRARYAIDNANSSVETAARNLELMAESNPAIDAILWLRLQPETGHLQSIFVRDAAREAVGLAASEAESFLECGNAKAEASWLESTYRH